MLKVNIANLIKVIVTIIKFHYGKTNNGPISNGENYVKLIIMVKLIRAKLTIVKLTMVK
jgi:hypothetical protein